jgi:hypothetical protein
MSERAPVAADDEFQGADVWRGRPGLFILYAFGAAVLVTLVVLGWPRMSPFYHIVAPLGALVFVYVLVRSVFNITRGREVMLAIGPRGIFDWRIAQAWMPWADIVRIEAVQRSGKAARGFRVKMNAEFAASFPETTMSRLLRWSNALTGLKGYTVAFGGLDGNADQIMRSLDRHFPQGQNLKNVGQT